MLSLTIPQTESYFSQEHLTSTTPYVSAPSSPNCKLDWQASKTQATDLFVFQTEWKEFMSSSQEFKAERRSERDVANSSSLTSSDFEFDLGVPDVADPPLSPKLIISQASVSPTFIYSDFWTDENVYTREVPVLAPVPRRSATSQSVRDLLAEEMSDDASSCASYPQSPRSQRGDGQLGRRGAERNVGDAAETKYPGARHGPKNKNGRDMRIFQHFSREQKNKSSPDTRIFQQSTHTRRVHHADEDHYLSSFDFPSSAGDCFAVEEPITFKQDRAEPKQPRKRWALKDLLRASRRSSDDIYRKTEQMENFSPRPSRSTPATPEGARPRSPARMSPRPMSPHEAHYKSQRAQWDEMKRKTTLPFKPGLLGCLGGAVFAGMPEFRAVM